MSGPPVREGRLRLALVVASVATALVLGEAGLRIAGWSYSPMRIEVEGKTLDWRFVHAFRDRHFVFDPVLLWRPKAGRPPFNRQGFRGPELTATKPAGQIRVFAVGDSNTLGWAEADGANWPLEMTPHLAFPGHELVVVNAGAWGYASYQGLGRLREVLAWSPDLVLVSFGANDAMPVAVADDAYAAAPFFALPIFRSPLFRSRVVQLGVGAWDRLRRPEPSTTASEPVPGLVPRVPLDAFRRHSQAMVDLCRARDVDVVLLSRPYVGTSDDPLWWKSAAPAYRDATFEVAEANDVLGIDVYAMFRDRDLLFADESHLTPEGHAIAAERIAGLLRPLIAARLRRSEAGAGGGGG